jgi:hypothetical protein
METYADRLLTLVRRCERNSVRATVQMRGARSHRSYGRRSRGYWGRQASGGTCLIRHGRARAEQ